MTDGRYQLPLYVTEAEIVERMGVGINSGRKALQEMRLHPKFPPRAIGGKRYWPSVVDFLDIWNGRHVVDAAVAPAEQPYRGRAWANLEAAEERLRRRMAGKKAALGPEAPEQDRARYGYTDEKGNFRRIVAGLRAGEIRVTGPDGRKWVENTKPTDPASWQRKRPFKPRKPTATE
jgi:hypothetical protein